MKIGMTGGDGFIGSNLPYEKISGDIRYLKPESLRGYDCVVHLGALTSVDESLEKPLEYYDVNVTGTYRVLQGCAMSNVPRFVFISSTSVLGLGNPYAKTKLMGEWLCKWMSKDFPIEIVALRLHNVYGQGCKGVIANFALAKKQGATAVVTGGGRQTRDFIHVQDVAEAIEKATKQGNGIYGVGTGTDTSIKQLASMMGVSYNFTDPRRNEVMVGKCPETEMKRIKEDLGWTPKVKLKQGLETLS